MEKKSNWSRFWTLKSNAEVTKDERKAAEESRLAALPSGLDSFLSEERDRIARIEDTTASFIADMKYALRELGPFITDAYKCDAKFERKHEHAPISRYGVKWYNMSYGQENHAPNEYESMPGASEVAFVYSLGNDAAVRVDYDVYFYHGIVKKAPGEDITPTGRNPFRGYESNQQPTHVDSLRCTRWFKSHEHFVAENKVPYWFLDHLKMLARRRSA